MPPRNRPSMFIGSSAEGLHIARAIQVEMDHECEVEIWCQGAFGLMGGTLESLVIASERFDFATFVVVPDDTTTSRGRKLAIARDNVIFELGLFIGAIGRSRTFMVTTAVTGQIYQPTSLGLPPLRLSPINPATSLPTLVRHARLSRPQSHASALAPLTAKRYRHTLVAHRKRSEKNYMV